MAIKSAAPIGFKGSNKPDTTIEAHVSNGRVIGLSLVGYDPPCPDVIKATSGIAQFGTDNRYPQHTIYQFENSPTHAAICRFTATLIAGMGFTMEGADENWLKTVGHGRSLDRIGKSLALDLKLHNGWAVQTTWSKDGTKVARIKYEDFSHVRKELDTDGNFTGRYFLCKHWKRGVTSTTKGVTMLPEFNPENVFEYQMTADGKDYALDSTKQRIKVMGDNGLPKIKEPNQLYYYEGTSPGKLHYPKPMHIAADTDIQIDIEFKAFHIGNIMNGMTPAFFMEVFGAIPEESEQDAFEASMQRAFKGKKGKKSFIKFTDDYNNKSQITPLDIKNNETRYLELIKFIISQIISAHMLGSPTLAGLAGTGGLGGNAAEIESAFKLYLDTVVLDMQDQLIEGMQHIMDLAGMPIKVGIKARNPFGDTSTTKTNNGNNTEAAA